MNHQDRHAGSLLVSFTHIGSDWNVPDLRVPSSGPLAARSRIHEFVAGRMDASRFTIQLLDDGGFIDLGTHNGGCFTLQRSDPHAARTL